MADNSNGNGNQQSPNNNADNSHKNVTGNETRRCTRCNDICKTCGKTFHSAFALCRHMSVHNDPLREQFRALDISDSGKKPAGNYFDQAADNLRRFCIGTEEGSAREIHGGVTYGDRRFNDKGKRPASPEDPSRKSKRGKWESLLHLNEYPPRSEEEDEQKEVKTDQE